LGEEERIVESLHENALVYNINEARPPVQSGFGYYELIPNEKNNISMYEAEHWRLKAKVWLVSENNASTFYLLLEKTLLEVEQLLLFRNALKEAQRQ